MFIPGTDDGAGKAGVASAHAIAQGSELRSRPGAGGRHLRAGRGLGRATPSALDELSRRRGPGGGARLAPPGSARLGARRVRPLPGGDGSRCVAAPARLPDPPDHARPLRCRRLQRARAGARRPGAAARRALGLAWDRAPVGHGAHERDRCPVHQRSRRRAVARRQGDARAAVAGRRACAQGRAARERAAACCRRRAGADRARAARRGRAQGLA